MARVRIMHYLNQFFAGIGGEDKANLPVGSLKGAVGPGKRLQELLGDAAEIVVTAYCGDNYFSEHREEALEAIVQVARQNQVALVAAGPAFASGRYGFACAEVCHAVRNSLSAACITAMHLENPGIETYKQYKDRKVYAFPTTEMVSGMGEALAGMAKGLARLAGGPSLGTAAKEGYIPRGFRVDKIKIQTGAVRAVDMLLDKLTGRPFTTEIPLEALEKIPVPAPITNLKDAYLALITTSGAIKRGNPDGFRGYQNTKWAKYHIGKMSSMLDGEWDVIHGGYNIEFMKRNPNYGVPLDVCRDMEKEGVFARLYPYYYVTPGARGLISVMHRIGKEIVTELKDEGADAVLLVAT